MSEPEEGKESNQKRGSRWVLWVVILLTLAVAGSWVFSYVQYLKLGDLVAFQESDMGDQIGEILDEMEQSTERSRAVYEAMGDKINQLSKSLAQETHERYQQVTEHSKRVEALSAKLESLKNEVQVLKNTQQKSIPPRTDTQS